MAFYAGSGLSAIVVAFMVFALGIMTRDWFVRRAHGIPHPDFFREGTPWLFGILGGLLAIGLSLAYLTR
ncbi:MAG TPA: hypothetical protein VL966_15850 [Alphaproteobacteria bacterium]|jgi:hypothetical protein|nr:hypothetical protein [Alphaproteobacteria bacterium]